MCKKCPKHHHMLLHRNADSLSQKKSEEHNKEETHLVALSVGEQVRLMTCAMKVTAADGSSTLVRALINLGSSASFVHELLAQHPRLLCSNKNAKFEGVGGASTPTHGSVWFQMSGIEDNVEKVGVEAYVLKKVTKDLPRHPTVPSSGTA